MTAETITPEQRARQICEVLGLPLNWVAEHIACEIRSAVEAERAYERESCANDAEAFGASQVADYLREFGRKRGRQ